MSKIKELRVSFIDKDTMCAVNPNEVEVYSDFNNADGVVTSLAAYYHDGKTEKEVEIKIIN